LFLSSFSFSFFSFYLFFRTFKESFPFFDCKIGAFSFFLSFIFFLRKKRKNAYKRAFCVFFLIQSFPFFFLCKRKKEIKKKTMKRRKKRRKLVNIK